MKLLRLPEVRERVGLSRNTVFKLIGEGKFPAPLRQGGGNFWPDTEIDAYLARLIAERDEQPTAVKAARSQTWPTA